MAKEKKGAALVGQSGRLMKRFTLPPGCSCREFVMRELDGNDDITVSVWCDERRDPGAERAKRNKLGFFMLERYEQVRCALVEVDGEPVNIDGLPWPGFDQWSKRTLAFAEKAFDSLNIGTDDDLGKFLAGAEVVAGPTTSPRGAPSAPSTGELSDD